MQIFLNKKFVCLFIIECMRIFCVLIFFYICVYTVGEYLWKYIIQTFINLRGTLAFYKRKIKSNDKNIILRDWRAFSWTPPPGQWNIERPPPRVFAVSHGERRLYKRCVHENQRTLPKQFYHVRSSRDKQRSDILPHRNHRKVLMLHDDDVSGSSKRVSLEKWFYPRRSFTLERVLPEKGSCICCTFLLYSFLLQEQLLFGDETILWSGPFSQFCRKEFWSIVSKEIWRYLANEWLYQKCN